LKTTAAVSRSYFYCCPPWITHTVLSVRLPKQLDHLALQSLRKGFRTLQVRSLALAHRLKGRSSVLMTLDMMLATYGKVMTHPIESSQP